MHRHTLVPCTGMCTHARVHTPAVSHAQHTPAHSAHMYTHTQKHSYMYALLCEAESASQPEISRVDIKQAGDQQA